MMKRIQKILTAYGELLVLITLLLGFIVLAAGIATVISLVLIRIIGG
jgi:hypothetical protein